MTRRVVIRGKVMRAPGLERLDQLRPRDDGADSAAPGPRDFKSGLFDKDAPRTWARDKALLVSLGVDGDVPLAQARVNAGLLTAGQQGGVKFANKNYLWRIPANDNNKSAAQAA